MAESIVLYVPERTAFIFRDLSSVIPYREMFPSKALYMKFSAFLFAGFRKGSSHLAALVFQLLAAYLYLRHPLYSDAKIDES
jgi:hypothetical protein